jgi:hypothetical protein
MTNFRRWLEAAERNPLDDFYGKIKRHVMASMRPQDGRVGFSFPDNYQSLISFAEPETISLKFPQKPVALAAGTLPEPVIEQTHAFKKGRGAQAAMKQIVMADPAWMDWDLFQQVVGAKFGDIAGPLGLIFEVDIFLYFLESMKLRDAQEQETVSSIDFFRRKKDSHVPEVQKVLKDPTHLRIALFTSQTHAEDLANDMYSKSASILKCKPAEVSFAGGTRRTVAGGSRREDPADIYLLCGQGHMGWSVKFAGQTEVAITDTGPLGAYKMLGGRARKGLKEELEAARESGDVKTLVRTITNKLTEAADIRFSNPATAPKHFANLMNDLVTAGFATLPAVRHYASTHKGGAGWSPALQKDFKIKDGKLRRRQGATVTVRPTETKLKISYKVPGGSRGGTNIIFVPQADGNVKIKVNNLTSSF